MPAPDGPERAGQDLPAPYESPWGLLRRDLIAVIASLRLRLQELWRRNREGDLSVPGVWPAALAPLFWPSLLALGLALAVALPLAGVKALQRPSAPLPQAGTPTMEPQVVLEQPPASPPEPELRLDPLLALLAEQDPEQLIRAARPVPAESRLVLELAGGFADRPAARRQQLAEQWLERSEALGYERLQLVDAGGRLLGRRARVGSGMILLSPDGES